MTKPWRWEVVVMEVVLCTRLPRTTSQRTIQPPRWELASSIPNSTTSLTWGLASPLQLSRTLKSWRSIGDLTPCRVAMRAIVSAGTAPPGRRKRIYTLTNSGLPTVTALTSQNPSTSKIWRWQMAVSRENSKFSISQTSEQTEIEIASGYIGYE